MKYLVSMTVAVEAPDMGSAVIRVGQHEMWPEMLRSIDADYLSISASKQEEDDDS